MITVHCIGNSHLDPVWLWDKSDGINAILATARSACDRLDEYPQFIFTCSGSFFHRQIELADPPLFERVRRFVAAGRWQLVGGMVVQPDCNLGTAWSIRKQIEHGQAYYRERFGRTTTIGYNVDSFGHGAYLPGLLRQGGIEAYVFMRPGQHEKVLQANLFRWRGPDGAELPAFRIAGAYCTSGADLAGLIDQAIAAMPPGAEDTMVFYGVGDHGGGPTKEQIQWIIRHADYRPGVRLVLSHPQAYFDAVAGRLADPPIVEGELQMHAIGCYGVERRIKAAMRQAEAAHQQLEAMAECAGRAGVPADLNGPELALAREAILFNQFHDIFCGTCIEPASARAAGELLAAEGTAQDEITRLCRRMINSVAGSCVEGILPSCPAGVSPAAEAGGTETNVHRIAIFNPSAANFRGLLRHEPWLYNARAKLALIDEHGRPVAMQMVDASSLIEGKRAMLFEADVPACGQRLFRLLSNGPQPYGQSPLGEEAATMQFVSMADPAPSSPGTVVSSPHCRAGVAGDTIAVGGWRASLRVQEDLSDTWSHGLHTFAGRQLGTFAWEGCEIREQGPHRQCLRCFGQFDRSSAGCRVELPAAQRAAMLRFSVTWVQQRQLLRLRLNAPSPLLERVDLVAGGPITRPLDGREYPLVGGLVVRTAGESLGIVCPYVFSVAADAGGVDLMVVRSPFVAHHDPAPAPARTDHPVTDQGRHTLDVQLLPGLQTATELQHAADAMLMPPLVWDLTG